MFAASCRHAARQVSPPVPDGDLGERFDDGRQRAVVPVVGVGVGVGGVGAEAAQSAVHFASRHQVALDPHLPDELGVAPGVVGGHGPARRRDAVRAACRPRRRRRPHAHVAGGVGGATWRAVQRAAVVVVGVVGGVSGARRPLDVAVVRERARAVGGAFVRRHVRPSGVSVDAAVEVGGRRPAVVEVVFAERGADGHVRHHRVQIGHAPVVGDGGCSRRRGGGRGGPAGGEGRGGDRLPRPDPRLERSPPGVQRSHAAHHWVDHVAVEHVLLCGHRAGSAVAVIVVVLLL